MNLRSLAPLRLGVSLGLLAVVGGWALQAAPPGWWSNGVTGGTPSPDSPANVGQLKNIAKRAAEHLDQHLPNGAGTEIWDMIDDWTVSAPDNFSPCNLAQVKATAKPFYARILSAGYDTKANLIARGYPANWAYDYPWNPSTPASENMVPCGLAQLKMVFSFDLAAWDTDADDLPNGWEASVGLDPDNPDENNNGIPDGADDFDGDGVSNYQEYLDGTNPSDPNDALNPPTQVADGSNQTQLMLWTPLY